MHPSRVSATPSPADPPRRLSARDAVVTAMIGNPGAGLPDVRDLDLAPFWSRFDAAAPLHLRLGFRLATIVIASVLPRLAGHHASLADLDADAADAVVQRAARWPLVAPLADVAKIVACFAYGADERVQDAVRGAR